jgi:hypothetical protein
MPEHLVGWIGHGVRGSGRSNRLLRPPRARLLNPNGQTGLIATNTLAHGDTCEVGPGQVLAAGTEIRQAIKSNNLVHNNDWRS